MATAVLIILAAPVILGLVVGVSTAAHHLVLLALGAARAPFEGTLRVVLHALSAYYLVGWLSFCGAILGAPWSLVLLLCCGALAAVMFAAVAASLKS